MSFSLHPATCRPSPADANWIESANSLMDDNKLLTLPSNERIRLLPHMKVGLGASLCWQLRWWLPGSLLQ